MKGAPCGTMRGMTPQQVADLIRAALPDADISVESEDERHFSARVVAREFAGLRSIARHQLIYRALGAPVGREIHALSIDALSPEEWTARTSS
jgi:acid stress-induced BolA-like protein IbaG/YrbA